MLHFLGDSQSQQPDLQIEVALEMLEAIAVVRSSAGTATSPATLMASFGISQGQPQGQTADVSGVDV